MNDTVLQPVLSDNDQIAQRKAKLDGLRARGNAFPNDFRRSHLAAELHGLYDQHDNAVLMEKPARVKVAGRIMTRRVMSKASFVHLQDMSGRIQLYLSRDDLPEGV